MKVAILAFDGVDDLDLFGPIEIFSQAKIVGADVSITVTSLTDQLTIKTHSGVKITCEGILDNPNGLIVPGGGWIDSGPGIRTLVENANIVESVRDAARNTEFTASVCTGIFLLAAAGLIDGKCVTTNSRALSDPAIKTAAQIKNEPVVEDGNLITSGGPITAIALSLHIIERFFGKNIRNEVENSIDLQP